MRLTCLLVDAVETRHRWLLIARYVAAGKRATHEFVAEESITLCFWINLTGRFLPGVFLLRSLSYLFVSPRGQRFIERKRSTQAALAVDITVVD